MDLWFPCQESLIHTDESASWHTDKRFERLILKHLVSPYNIVI